MDSNHETQINFENVTAFIREDSVNETSTLCISYKGVCFANAYVSGATFSMIAGTAMDISNKISELDDATLITKYVTGRGFFVASPNPILEVAN